MELGQLTHTGSTEWANVAAINKSLRTRRMFIFSLPQVNLSLDCTFRIQAERLRHKPDLGFTELGVFMVLI